MSLIPQSAINEIHNRIDILEIVGEFVALKKRGANYFGLSPFQTEKTPSFTVSAPKQIFKDFASGKGGNAVTFLMEINGMTYPEVMHLLGERYDIDTKGEQDENAPPDNRGAIKAAMKQAANLYHGQVGKAIEYFTQRGLSRESIDKFQLGYSPHGKDWLSKRMIATGYNKSILIEANLCMEYDGKLIDRFRGRLMFPICDAFGNVIAFGARATDDNQKAKYINTGETPIYHKSKVLYGLSEARKSIVDSNKAILVEGYMDVIVMHQNGFANTIASCGTALTPEQCNLVSRYGKSILIARDSDTAGIKAAERDLKVLLNQELFAAVLPFPKGYDPDSFVTEKGSEAMQAHIEKNSRNFVDFLVAFYRNGQPLNEPQVKASVAKECKEVLKLIKDQVLRHSSVERLSSLLGVPRHLLGIASVNQHQETKQSTTGAFAAHERNAIGLFVNHGCEIIGTDSVKELMIEALEQIPNSSMGNSFVEFLEVIRGYSDCSIDNLLQSSMSEVIQSAISIDQPPTTIEVIQATCRCFAIAHIDILLTECKERIKKDPNQTNINKLTNLMKMRRDI